LSAQRYPSRFIEQVRSYLWPMPSFFLCWLYLSLRNPFH
jgi:hypothetical protein